MADEKRILGQNVNVYRKMKGMKKEADVARDVEILRSLFHHCTSNNDGALLERMVKSMMDHPDEYRVVSYAGYTEKPVHVSIALSRAIEIIWEDLYDSEELATYDFDRNYMLRCLGENSYYCTSAISTENNSLVGGGNKNNSNAASATTVDSAAKEQAKCCSSSTCKGIQDDKEIKNYFLVDENLVCCGACLDDNLPLKVRFMSKNDRYADWTPSDCGYGTNESPNNSASDSDAEYDSCNPPPPRAWGVKSNELYVQIYYNEGYEGESVDIRWVGRVAEEPPKVNNCQIKKKESSGIKKRSRISKRQNQNPPSEKQRSKKPKSKSTVRK